MEGADQRSQSRRLFRYQQGPAAGAQRAVGGEQSRPAGRDRIPRHDDAAIHRRPDGMGGDRRAHHREPDPSRAGFRAFLPGRLQERHRRQCPHRSGCREVGLASAPFHGGDQGRALGDCGNHRQRGLPHHPARRPPAELRPGKRRCRLRRTCPCRRGAAAHDRHQPRQQQQEAGEPAAGRGRHRPADLERRAAHHRRHDREQSGRRPPGRGAGQAARPTGRASPTAASTGRRRYPR